MRNWLLRVVPAVIAEVGAAVGRVTYSEEKYEIATVRVGIMA